MMARYDDYVQDTLEQEIGDAAEQSEQRAQEDHVPERFRGKSQEDIINSYLELERAFSRQGNDMGKLRQTVDELVQLQQESSGPEQASAQPVSVDDLYDNPDEVLRRVVREESTKTIKQLEKQLEEERKQRRIDSFDAKFPKWKEKITSNDFRDWVQESPLRLNLAQRADQYDLDAAEEVLGMYYEAQSNKQEREQPRDERGRFARDPQTEQELRAARSERGSPAPTDLVEAYSRSELMEKRIEARKGSLTAQRWLDAHSADIQRAYAEGRITD